MHLVPHWCIGHNYSYRIRGQKPRISIPPSLQTVTNISDIYIAWYHALINVKHLMCLSIVNHKMYEKKYSDDAPFSLWKGSLTKKKDQRTGVYKRKFNNDHIYSLNQF